jgi:hypothetical protein
LRTEPVKENYLSTDVEFIEYKVIHRVCEVCQM